MRVVDLAALDACLARLTTQLRDRRPAPDHWTGHLASSALSTGTAVLALQLATTHGFPHSERLAPLVEAGVSWLVAHQNADGGWGDTVRSRSNISTTAIVWASLSVTGAAAAADAIARGDRWLNAAAGSLEPDALRDAILRRYGNDRTFSVPILTVLALAGKLGSEVKAGWRRVPQLPFELAALPHQLFQHMQLPVVSYALPALIAIGQVRHHFAPSRNPVTRALRTAVAARTRTVLRAMQPDSGGYLEASPLTSFVVMSLAAAGQARHAVVEAGVRFLVDSVRPDGSWPIDSDLSTWITTLSSTALSQASALTDEERAATRRWIRAQQSASEHPFTHAAPGAWAWTPLSGGVPDADDTAGAMVALAELGEVDPKGAEAGARWLLGVQNRDGGIPTFCRGWGTLPFDRSTPELTAHALRGWSAWSRRFHPSLQADIGRGAMRAITFLAASQRSDGSWIPLWFGNEAADNEDNPVHGTARVLLGLETPLAASDPRARAAAERGGRWLVSAQNDDGGWGGQRGVPSSVEETGVVLSALAGWQRARPSETTRAALIRGAEWLVEVYQRGEPLPAPIGLYFARLWYFEELYPLIFAVDGLASARVALAGTAVAVTRG